LIVVVKTWVGVGLERRRGGFSSKYAAALLDKSGVWKVYAAVAPHLQTLEKAWLTTLKSSLTMVSVSEGCIGIRGSNL
jgi:hypothetical protein